MKGLKSLDFSSFPLSNQMHYGSMFDTMNMKSISKRTGIVPGLILGYQHQKYNAHLLTLHFQNQQTLEHAHYIDYTDFFFFFFCNYTIMLQSGWKHCKTASCQDAKGEIENEKTKGRMGWCQARVRRIVGDSL